MYNLIIKQATIIDGTGAPGWTGDVGIKDEIFSAIKPSLEAAETRETVSGKGLVIAPGFIDIHTHSDDFWKMDSLSEIKLQQGVTREVIGNCGISLSPTVSKAGDIDFQGNLVNLDKHTDFMGKFSLNDYRKLLEKFGLSNNLMGLIGHGTLRMAVMGFSENIPDKRQMETMKFLMEEAMNQGASGMSTGLIYAPGIFAKIPELVELCRVVAKKGGFYASHMRNEAEEILAAIDEAISIGEQSGVPVQISHLKITGHKNWGLVDQVIKKFLDARNRGIDVTCDVYPYISSGTSLTALVPPWAIEGGVEKLILRMHDSVQRAKIIHDIKHGIPGWENMYHNAGWEKITISRFDFDGQNNIEGRTVAQIAKGKKVDPFDLILDLMEQGGNGVKIISETMNEENLATFLKLPFAMVGSDSSFTTGKPHPRLYGTFPRVIRRFVRELRVLTLEEAIHKMTGLTAQRLRLTHAGLIKKGFQADAVLFDPETITDRGTYQSPEHFPSGIARVIVNGKTVIKNGIHTGAKPGRFDFPH